MFVDIFFYTIVLTFAGPLVLTAIIAVPVIPTMLVDL